MLLQFTSFSLSKFILSPLCNSIAAMMKKASLHLQMRKGKRRGMRVDEERVLTVVMLGREDHDSLKATKCSSWNMCLFFFPTVFNCLSCIQPNHKTGLSLH